MVHAYDTRFAQYASAFGSFARSHNLIIEKYAKDQPMWSFGFSHPRGGQAKLDVLVDGAGVVTVQSVWWIDSYAAFTRSLKWGAQIVVSDGPAAATSALELELANVAAWTPGDWTDVADGYRPIWSTYSEAEFRALAPQWPQPVL